MNSPLRTGGEAVPSQGHVGNRDRPMHPCLQIYMDVTAQVGTADRRSGSPCRARCSCTPGTTRPAGTGRRAKSPPHWRRGKGSRWPAQPVAHMHDKEPIPDVSHDRPPHLRQEHSSKTRNYPPHGQAPLMLRFSDSDRNQVEQVHRSVHVRRPHGSSCRQRLAQYVPLPAPGRTGSPNRPRHITTQHAEAHHVRHHHATRARNPGKPISSQTGPSLRSKSPSNWLPLTVTALTTPLDTLTSFSVPLARWIARSNVTTTCVGPPCRLSIALAARTFRSKVPAPWGLSARPAAVIRGAWATFTVRLPHSKFAHAAPAQSQHAQA